ncbi:MAG: flippase [Acidobacteriota bacterium]
MQPRSTAGMTTKVVKGSIWTLAGQIFPLGASLVATPFVIRFLGAEQYGVLALINVLLGYLAFADFGMSLASTNFASEAYAKGSVDKEGKAVRLAVLIGLGTTTITAVLVIIFARVIVVDLLRIPDHLQDVAVIGIYLSCVTFTSRVLSAIVCTPQLVRLRMDLNSSVNAIFNVVQIVTVPLVIFLGGGLIGAVITIMCSAIGALLVHLVVSRKLLRSLFEFSIDPDAVKPLLRFGSSIFIALVASVLLANLEKVVLTRYTSVTVLAYYTVAFTLANMMTLFAASMAQSLIPAFSQLYSNQQVPELQALYARAIRLNLVIFAPVAMVLALIAEPFFTIWAGEEFGRESTIPFYTLLAGLMFSFAASVAGAMLVAARKTHASAILYWVELFPYLIVVTGLTLTLGAVGAALAWSLRLVVETAALLFIVKRTVGLSFDIVDKKMLTLMFGILLLSISPILTVLTTGHTGVLAAVALVCLGVYALMIWFRVLSIEEKNFLRGKLSGFAPFRRLPR